MKLLSSIKIYINTNIMPKHRKRWMTSNLQVLGLMQAKIDQAKLQQRSKSHPGGNLFDGLPPVPLTGLVRFWALRFWLLSLCVEFRTRGSPSDFSISGSFSYSCQCSHGRRQMEVYLGPRGFLAGQVSCAREG